MTLDITKLSPRYEVRQLGEEDFPAILALYQSNPQYFAPMGQEPPQGGLEEDLAALPPGKTMEDKYFLGFFREGALAALLELVTGYPDEGTGYIGLFMVDARHQGQGEGSRLIGEILAHLKDAGLGYAELCYSYGNQQSEHFWMKNGFIPTGSVRQQGEYYVISLFKKL